MILTLNSLAAASGLSFDSISQGGASSAAAVTTTDPYAVEPIQVQFSGSYYNLLAFLQRIRNLVRVENGKLFTAGRLFDVTNVALTQGRNMWPQVQAALTIDEFVPQPVVTTPSTTVSRSAERMRAVPQRREIERARHVEFKPCVAPCTGW